MSSFGVLASHALVAFAHLGLVHAPTHHPQNVARARDQNQGLSLHPGHPQDHIADLALDLILIPLLQTINSVL